MNDVVFLSVKEDVPADSYWDQTLLKHVFAQSTKYFSTSGLQEAVVIIPGAYQGDSVGKINKELSILEKCKVIITSDEENNFPIDELDHPDMEVYATYMTDKYERYIKWLPIGPADMVEVPYEPKTLDWFFAGQVNHDSRRQLLKVLSSLDNGYIYITPGFAQGLDPDEYYKMMSCARSVPAPRGNISPDSFRFYEALEVGAVPIPENKEFWNRLFPDLPLEVVDNWQQLPRVMNKPITDQSYRNECIAWWARKKLEIKDELTYPPEVTVVIPVSPILTHPSTVVIDETIESIKRQLPKARIIVTFDGVRQEQSGSYHEYQEFIERFLRKYKDVYPIMFKEHTHQVGMMREAMKHINSEYVVYVEQDTPFTSDYIDWEGCIDSLRMTDLIRFHFEAFIPEPHKYLMMEEIENSPVPLLRTKQWSQRPHLTTKKFYEKVLTNFSENAKSFIEDKMHSVAQEFPTEYRLAIYYPEKNIKRTYHIDGRAGADKYDDTQVF